MSNIAVITARGGSKRIPKKNIKLFRGKPIIAYSIETALKSGLFDEVIVSTNDVEIASVAINHGASVPFYRSPLTSDDFSGTADVMLEVLQQLQQMNRFFEYACCIYPTAPFISVANLEKSFRLLKENEFDSVFPVCAFSYPILRALHRDDNGKTKMIWPENLLKRSQDLQTSYHDAGQFYWMSIASFLKERKIFTNNSGSIILNELEVQDIDNESDWKLAELKYSLKLNKN